MHTKFSQLRYLKPILYYFDIPDIISINAELFKKDKITPYEEIQSVFKERSVAIRSSAADEDGESNSLAGEYESVLNVSSNDLVKVISAIDAVILSYERKRPLLAGDEIIVQKMLQKISMSGVIFTHDFNTGAPYYVVNYDDKSGLTDTVTSGDGEHSNRTIYIHRNSVKKLRSERFKILLQAVQELECVMESQFLDIEFALGEDLTPYLLQVRAITTCIKWNKIVSSQIDDTLEEVQEAVRIAGAEEFINKLPQGIETVIGEDAIRLSGGQRQRLDLARALVRKALILILDEPTSNLDAESEDLFRQVLQRIRKEVNITIIIVAHRLASIADADQIVVLNQGAVEDIGKHNDLLKKGGWYAKAWKMQSSITN